MAVVRYFGGIKLGAGGLVRAYSSSAAENLDGADIRVLEMCAERIIEVEYTGVDSVQKYISSHTCTLLNTDYGCHSIFAIGAGAVTKMVSADNSRIKRAATPKYPYEYLSPENSETIRREYFEKIRDFYARLDAARAADANK